MQWPQLGARFAVGGKGRCAGAGSRPGGRARQSPAASPPPRETGRRPALPLEAHPAATSTSSPSLTFSTITFEFGSAQLRPESVETLRNLGNALNQELKDEKAFVIEGHTDRTGTRTYNDALSSTVPTRSKSTL